MFRIRGPACFIVASGFRSSSAIRDSAPLGGFPEMAGGQTLNQVLAARLLDMSGQHPFLDLVEPLPAALMRITHLAPRLTQCVSGIETILGRPHWGQLAPAGGGLVDDPAAGDFDAGIELLPIVPLHPFARLGEIHRNLGMVLLLAWGGEVLRLPPKGCEMESAAQDVIKSDRHG